MNNKEYRYEMHLHTKEFGWCASVYARDIVDIYYKEGFDGICITNHYFKEGMNLIKGGTWEEKLDEWLKGYNVAKEYALKYEGFNVILAAELKLEEGSEDFLLYGITRELLLNNPEIFDFSLAQCHEFAIKNNVLIFQAHPYRQWLKQREISLLDGIEVYNGNPRHNSNNHKALETAKKHDMLMIAGSDFHEFGDEATAAMIFPYPITDSVQMAKALRAKDGKIWISNSV